MRKALARTAQSILGAVGLALAVAWLSGAFHEKVRPGESPPVERTLPPGATTAVVTAVDEPVVERVSGTVASAHQIDVAAKILARIEKIHVTAGSTVAEGDVLVTLDSRDLEARVREARERQRAAAAQLELARTELARIQRLAKEGVASRQQLDRATSAERVAAAELKAASQRLADAKVALSYAVIRSPVSGRVIDRLAEPGDTATPGVPLLRLYDPSLLRAEAPVRESLAVTLEPGQGIRAEIEAIGEVLDGEIDEIVPYAEPGARTLLVKVRLPRDPRLVEGLFARVEIPAGTRRRLLAPAAAIRRVGQLEFADVLREDGSIERRLVTTGRPVSPGRIEVLSGLSAGERVAISRS